jgi:serine/threonine protein phosphatase PrpC
MAELSGDIQHVNPLEICSGSITGSEHVRVGKNNQDALSIDRIGLDQGADFTVAVVSDGCGSGVRSEIGAFLGARILSKLIVEQAVQGLPLTEPEVWGDFQRQFTMRLTQVLLDISASNKMKECVEETFLFTLVGIYIGPRYVIPFSVGDGLLIVNDIRYPLGPFPNNAPPYPGYALIKKNGGWNTQDIAFKLCPLVPRSEFKSALLGTDGLLDFEKVESDLSQFYREEKYFKNKDAVRRKLALMNQIQETIDYENRTVKRSHPQLPDDTTLIGIRSNPWPIVT